MKWRRTSYQPWVNQRYNIRGWLTGIDPTSLAAASGEPADLFQMDLLYLDLADAALRQWEGNIGS